MPALTPSEQEWLDVRDHLREHRVRLTAEAASLYPEHLKVAGEPLLSTPDWRPGSQLPLDGIKLSYSPEPNQDVVPLGPELTELLRPMRADGTRYPSYAAALGALARPRVFEDRSTYRLRRAYLAGDPHMDFGAGSYFDSVNVGEACAHEFAAAAMGLVTGTPLRDAIGDPCDPLRRPVNVAISALTLRQDVETGELTFPLHWRDPAAVAHAGGLSTVIPVGIFQAAAEGPGHQRNDFSLWRCLVREYAEELLGEPEADPGDAPIDYSAWPFAAHMTQGVADGRITAAVLGLGVDPLTFATDILAAMTIRGDYYDDLFAAAVAANAEGIILSRAIEGPPLSRVDGDKSDRTPEAMMQPASAAVLRLALQTQGSAMPPRT